MQCSVLYVFFYRSSGCRYSLGVCGQYYVYMTSNEFTIIKCLFVSYNLCHGAKYGTVSNYMKATVTVGVNCIYLLIDKITDYSLIFILFFKFAICSTEYLWRKFLLVLKSSLSLLTFGHVTNLISHAKDIPINVFNGVFVYLCGIPRTWKCMHIHVSLWTFCCCWLSPVDLNILRSYFLHIWWVLCIGIGMILFRCSKTKWEERSGFWQGDLLLFSLSDSMLWKIRLFVYHLYYPILIFKSTNSNTVRAR